jgi:hypothetical protein
MKTEEKADKVKLFASLIAYVPPLVLRVGVAFLRLKRRVRRTSRSFEKGLLSRGMAPEVARRLALSYEGDLRTRTMLKRLTGGTFPRGGAW